MPDDVGDTKIANGGRARVVGETVRLVQCPVITIVLETPLTLTALLLQATVLFLPTPEMVI